MFQWDFMGYHHCVGLLERTTGLKSAKVVDLIGMIPYVLAGCTDGEW